MKLLKFPQKHMGAYSLFLSILLISTSCSLDNDLTSEILGPNHCLKFTDSPNFECDQPEVIFADGSYQNIELSVKEVVCPEIPIPSYLDAIVDEWDDNDKVWINVKENQKNRTSHYFEGSFFRVNVDNENNTPTINIELDKNSADHKRKIRLYIISGAGIKETKSYGVGKVEVIQRYASFTD